MMAFAASISGAGGTWVSPAPSLAERSRVEPECTLRVICEPLALARDEPSAAESNLLEARVRVDPTPPAESGRLGADTVDAAVGTGALP
jgi:hypothetical protein